LSKNIAKEEGVSAAEHQFLNRKEGRVTKNDIFRVRKNRTNQPAFRFKTSPVAQKSSLVSQVEVIMKWTECAS
jgi:hypothetical protein